MLIEIKAPSPGESITQVTLASWLAEDGAWVMQDAEIAEIESDKATLMIFAPASGQLKIQVEAGATVDVGTVLGAIDDSVVNPGTSGGKVQKTQSAVHTEEIKTSGLQETPEVSALHLTPLARHMAESEHIPAEQLKAIHKDKISRKDVLQLMNTEKKTAGATTRPHERVKMSPLRLKLAERLVSVKNETAMLTTFNEVDMSAIMDLRKQYGERYKARYGNNIGFISFFVMAAQRAFEDYPKINAAIDGDEIIYYKYADICIAVSTPKGLLAPAIRDVQELNLSQIDQAIRDFGVRAQTNKITLEELRGGTFTITNGGTFGSMLSTPLINPPQSAILGMHKIEERPVAINGKVEVRPMMYIALSYDHRLIDGKESVGFVVKVKEYLEHPLSMIPADSSNPEAFLGIV